MASEMNEEPPPLLLGVSWSSAVVFGVVLPVLALVVEIGAGVWGSFGFDPIPTVWHVFAIALVPLSNGLVLRALSRHPFEVTPRLAWMNAATIGVSLFYSLCFVPLVPLAAMGVLFVGLGLLPLSPYLSLLTAVLLRRAMRRRLSAGGRLPGFWAGALGALGLLLLLELPMLTTAWAASQVSGSGARERAALAFLRLPGRSARLLEGHDRSSDHVRRSAYAALGIGVDASAAALAYYRATGRAHTQATPRSRFWGPEPLRPGDELRGGTEVGRKLKHLALAESRLDGSVDADAAVGYLEWTLVFRNDGDFAEEARALVALPPGAVVSRLTLWVHGEEREAAFATRGAVRTAYERVVRRGRDPVLVTTAGLDRVLVQCFPVEPQGEMKIRFGVTVPMPVSAPDTAHFALPRILEQNFNIPDSFTHALWLEGRQPFLPGDTHLVEERAAEGHFALRGALTSDWLREPLGVALRRDPASTHAWTRSPWSSELVITQTFTRRAPAAGPLHMVVDGSKGMREAAHALADVLERTSTGREVVLLFAGDRPASFPATSPAAVAALLRKQTYAGGQDSSTSLRLAIEGAAREEGEVFWLHGAQPVRWQEPGALQQTIGRGRRAPVLAFTAVSGAHRILADLEASSLFRTAPRMGKLEEDLARAVTPFFEGGTVALRQVRPAGEDEPEGKQTSAHLARLWAAEEVTRKLENPSSRDSAAEVAVAAQLVTPVTGAVVLETATQYEEAGLRPVEPGTVPTIPEPETLALLVVAALALLAARRSARLRRSA